MGGETANNPGQTRLPGSLVVVFCVCLAVLNLTRSTAPGVFAQIELSSICSVQGSGFSSLYLGEILRVRGVVTLDMDSTYRRGFYLQEADCDNDPETSDGIYIYLGVQENRVQPGDLVEVSGLMQEYYGLSEIDVSLGSLEVLLQDSPLPTPLDLAPPFDNDAAALYFESLEGMLVQIAEANVVGPTNDSDETWVVPASLGVYRVLQGDWRGTGEIVLLDDGGPYELDGNAKVGDLITQLYGVLDYNYGAYRLQQMAVPALVIREVPNVGDTASAASGITFSTFNMHNLFDTLDDPTTDDIVLGTTVYLRKLQKLALAIHEHMSEPALIAVQEVENLAVLQDLLNQSVIESEYQAAWMESIDQRGIDTALLYRDDLVNILDITQRQGCTTLIDGLGPDGNGNPEQPENLVTCDSDGDTVLDGNRLFSRPPLVVHLIACPQTCTSLAEPGALEMVVIVNHWKSKSEDTETVEYTLPRRLEQAVFTGALAQAAHQTYPEAGVLVVGDLNDYPDSTPLQTLAQAELSDFGSFISDSTRYSYIYQGISQELDYLMANLPGAVVVAGVRAVHINADYPSSYASISDSALGSSDHDPLLAHVLVQPNKAYLPFTNHP